MNLYRTSLDYWQFSTFCTTPADAAKYSKDGQPISYVTPHPACVRRILRLPGRPTECIKQAFMNVGVPAAEAADTVNFSGYESCGDLTKDALGLHVLRRLAERWDWLVFEDYAASSVWMRLHSDPIHLADGAGTLEESTAPVEDEAF